MPVAGIGVDLARIERFRRLLIQGKRSVLERLFVPGELELAFSRVDPAPALAARFAAKEAFLKALGLGLRQGIRWQDMAVDPDDLGRPRLQLAGRADAICRDRGIVRVHLSYSHEQDYAVAMVVLEQA